MKRWFSTRSYYYYVESLGDMSPFCTEAAPRKQREAEEYKEATEGDTDGGEKKEASDQATADRV